MRVLVYEDNLMWSARLKNSLVKLGHEPVLLSRPTVETGEAAIVNLGADSLAPADLVPQLRASGIRVIGHAGHKEKELHQLGQAIGCDILATNSEMTFKLESLLARI